MKKIVILTGAGISAESGIKTFRDANGLWENHPIEDVATPEGFERNPDLVYDFYNARRQQLLEPEIKPNAAHQVLERLFEKFEVLLVTQNVDDLHDRTKCPNLIHMHGELLKARCSKTENIFIWKERLDKNSICPCCNSSGNLRPHIVWFGEMPLYMKHIFDSLQNCDLFISIGTSAQVYPAAMFFQEAKQYGAKTIELNLEKTPASSHFDITVQGKATEIVPKLVEEILNGKII